MTTSAKKAQRFKRRALTTAAGAAAAAALTVGSLFNTADELLDDSEADLPAVEAAAVEIKAAPAQPQKLADRLRAFFLGQNAVVRGIVLLPLWAVGKALLTLLSLVWGALAPNWPIIFAVLGNALLIAALFLFVYKVIFPDARLGDLFKKKRWLWLAGGALLLAAADAVLKVYWADYKPVSIFIKLFCGFVVLCTLSFRIFGRKTAKA